MFSKRSSATRRRGGSGFGFRGSSPPYPYTGRGRGGLPRCQYPGDTITPRGAFPPGGAAPLTREQEIEYLKNQTAQIKQELENIESRVHELETGK